VKYAEDQNSGEKVERRGSSKQVIDVVVGKMERKTMVS
jgi:hypothetical protein